MKINRVQNLVYLKYNMNLKDTIENYKQIVLINEVGYIGDSCIFFWPIVESCVTCFPDKTFTIYHQYSEVFNSLHTNLSCLDLKNINKQDSDTKTDFKIELGSRELIENP